MYKKKSISYILLFSILFLSFQIEAKDPIIEKSAVECESIEAGKVFLSNIDFLSTADISQSQLVKSAVTAEYTTLHTRLLDLTIPNQKLLKRDLFFNNDPLFYDVLNGQNGVKAWEKLINTGLRTNIKWLETTSKWIDDGLELTSTASKVTIKKAGVEVGEISGDLLKVKYSGLGGDIVSHPTKTTSAIGRYQLTGGGAGTKNLIESGLTKSGENAGGINVLNDLTNTHGWPDQQIWDQINKPWIDAAIGRGDVIRAVSDPTLPANLFKDGISGDLTFFGREHFHLTQVNGYIYNASTFTYTK